MTLSANFDRKKFNVRYSVLIPLFLSTFVLISCSNSDLSRGDAKATLEQAKNGPKIITKSYSGIWLHGKRSKKKAEESVSFWNNYLFSASDEEAELMIKKILGGFYYKDLRDFVKQMGIERFEWEVYPDKLGKDFIIFGIPVITKKFSEYCKTQKGSSRKAKRSSTCTYTVGNWKVGEITGISGEGNNRLVEYQMKLQPTEIGTQLGITAETKDRQASFRKYDDGWRLVE